MSAALLNIRCVLRLQGSLMFIESEKVRNQEFCLQNNEAKFFRPQYLPLLVLHQRVIHSPAFSPSQVSATIRAVLVNE